MSFDTPSALVQMEKPIMVLSYRSKMARASIATALTATMLLNPASMIITF